MSEEKAELWGDIVNMAASCQIVQSGFELLGQGMLEDKEHLLIYILTCQQRHIAALENIIKG
jgi:hypothetical protein